MPSSTMPSCSKVAWERAALRVAEGVKTNLTFLIMVCGSKSSMFSTPWLPKERRSLPRSPMVTLMEGDELLAGHFHHALELGLGEGGVGHGHLGGLVRVHRALAGGQGVPFLDFGLRIFPLSEVVVGFHSGMFLG